MERPEPRAAPRAATLPPRGIDKLRISFKRLSLSLRRHLFKAPPPPPTDDGVLPVPVPPLLQRPMPDGGTAQAEWLAECGQFFQRALHVPAALQCFEAACALAPDRVEYLAMTAKLWSDAAFFYFDSEPSDEQRRQLNERALEWAQRCIAVDPGYALGHVALAVAKTRLALFSAPRAKVKLAKEAFESAQDCLKVHPDSDIAHHLVGRWLRELACINKAMRLAVRFVFGASLAGGSRPDALARMQRAAELAPQRLVHRAEAGRLLLELGRGEEAVVQLEAALRMEVEDVNAWHTRCDAQELLAKHHKKPYQRPSFADAVRRACGGSPPALSIDELLSSKGSDVDAVGRARQVAAALPPPPPEVPQLQDLGAVMHVAP